MDGATCRALEDINFSDIHYAELFEALTKQLPLKIRRSYSKTNLTVKFEEMTDFCQNIKRLVRIAYPKGQKEIIGDLAFRTFRDAYNDNNIQRSFIQVGIDNIGSASNQCLKYDVFHLHQT